MEYVLRSLIEVGETLILERGHKVQIVAGRDKEKRRVRSQPLSQVHHQNYPATPFYTTQHTEYTSRAIDFRIHRLASIPYTTAKYRRLTSTS